MTTSGTRLTGAVLVLSTLTYFAGLFILFIRADFLEFLDAPTSERLRIVATYPKLYQWSFAIIAGGIILTALGLGLLADLLRGAGEPSISRLAFYGFLFGALLWVIDLAFFVSVTPMAAQQMLSDGMVPAYYEPLEFWGETLHRICTFLAYPAMAAFGWALLKTRFLPAWLGWLVIVWSGVWMVRFLAGGLETIPLLHHVMPLVMGVLLLFRKGA